MIRASSHKLRKSALSIIRMSDGGCVRADVHLSYAVADLRLLGGDRAAVAG
jgi:hypothetical protein